MNVTIAVARALRVVRVTVDAPFTDLSASAATGALNPANWSFVGQVVQPTPVAVVAALSVAEISTTVVDVTTDDDMSPEQIYQITAKASTDGGITGMASSPDNKAVFQAIALTPPAERDFSALKMVPRMNLREDSSGDLVRFLGVVNDVLQLSLHRVDHWPDIFDYDLAPENFLDLMLQDGAYPFTIALSEIDKRRLLSVLVTMYRQKGTVVGLKNAIRFFIGYEADILSPDWSQYGGWILGVSDLDFDTILGSFFFSSPLQGPDMAVFTGATSFDFWVKVGKPGAAALTTDEEAKTRAVIGLLKGVQEHLIGLSSNLPPPQNAAATPGAGTITLTWDAVAGADGYTIFWSTTPAVGALTQTGSIDPDNASPYIDTVTTGVQKYYVVCAHVAGVNGVASSRVTAIAL